MRAFLLALSLLATAFGGLLTTTQVASAQNCFYGFDGRLRCVEEDRPRYRERYYERRRYDDGRYYRRGRDPNAGCPRGYTVQDGQCKPYRGY